MHTEAPEEVCSLLLHWKCKVVTFLSISCPTSTITADHEWLCVFYSCHLGDDHPVPLLPYTLGSLLSAFINNYSMQIETRSLYTAGGFLSLTLPLNSRGLGSKQRALHIACSSRSQVEASLTWKPPGCAPAPWALTKGPIFWFLTRNTLRSGQLLQVCPAGGLPLLILPRSPWKVWPLPSNPDLKPFLLIFKRPCWWSFTP